MNRYQNQYTMIRGRGTSFNPMTDLTQLRPWEQKIRDEYLAKRDLQGPPVCYPRFVGEQREDFFCDTELVKEKEQERTAFAEAQYLSDEEKRQLAAAYDKEQFLISVRAERERYLQALDKSVNETPIPPNLGYPPRLGSPTPDLIYRKR